MPDLEKYRSLAASIPLFKGLMPEEVAYIFRHGKTVFFHAGKAVFHQGQPGANLFVVLAGRVALYDKERLIGTLHRGDAFGEMAVLNHRPRTATAAAMEDCELFTLDERELNHILEKHLAIRLLLNIIHVLSDRLEVANTTIAKMAHHATELTHA